MAEFSSEKFRKDLIKIVECIRDLCAARVPENLGHYTGSQLRMITRIYELTRNTEDGIQLKTLAGVLRITPAATSEMVETLVKRGALERRVDPNDRRAMSLRLTSGLESVFKDAEKHLDGVLEEFFAGVSPEERNFSMDIISRLNKFFINLNQPENKL